MTKLIVHLNQYLTSNVQRNHSLIVFFATSSYTVYKRVFIGNLEISERGQRETQKLGCLLN